MPSHIDQNRAAWDRLAQNGSQFARVATDEECAQPLKTLDSRGWLPKSVAGLDVLCLAAGGGWQSILYAAAGANVTVVDLSPSMLKQDHDEARKRGYAVTVVETSMDDLSMFPDARFDIVHQPVSTCYVDSIERVYSHVGRIARPGSLYISQHKQPTNLQVISQTKKNHFVLGIEYYRDGKSLPETSDTSYRESRTREYLHRWEQICGGLCRAGYVIEDLTEPCRADPNAPVSHFGYRGRFVPPYVRIKARRLSDGGQTSQSKSAIWVPGQ